MKISVIVPCHFVHFPLLSELLTNLSKQTALPDEVVISLSESDNVSAAAIKELLQAPWPFAVQLLPHQEKLSAGQNRNRAAAKASGDVLISQDADDIPHPQRVEIIKYLFEKYKIDHLMHYWILPHQSFTYYQLDQLAELTTCQEDYETAVNYYQQIPEYGDVTNGNIALLRKVFETVQWPDATIGEDERYNRNIYKIVDSTAVLRAPLLIYRNQYSSYHSSSYPYISGDTFRAYADFIYDEVHLPFAPKKVQPFATIFVQTSYLPYFAKNLHPKIAAPYILITHNSKLPIPGAYKNLLDDEKLIAWFGCHVEGYSHPKLHPIPTGLSNRTLERGDITLFDKRSAASKTILLTASFSEPGMPYFCRVSPYTALDVYLQTLAASQFVICPKEGPEIWEALYMGAIPIVRSTSRAPDWEELPIITIQDWSEITESFLRQKQKELSSGNIKQLNAEYWFAKINNLTKTKGI